MTQSDRNVCPRCGRQVKVSVNGIIGRHRDVAKEPCWANERTIDEVRRAIDADKAKLAWMQS